MYYIDKRVVHSRELMVKTLLELLQNKPLSKVTVKELCDKSGVARTTFYRNHSSLEELLTERLKDWYYITFDDLINDKDFTDNLNLRFFKACEKDFELFRIITKNNLDSQIIVVLKKYIDSVIKKIFELNDSVRNTPLFYNYPYSLYAFIGTAQMTIVYWIENDTLTAEEITSLFESYNNW
jgi:AcrR family transcriptional regulator